MGWGAVAGDICDVEGGSTWDKLADDICLSQSSDDQLMEEASALCEESDGEIRPEPRPGYALKTWWARQLESHTLALGYPAPSEMAETSAIRVVSCCSGACSELMALKDSVCVRLNHQKRPRPSFRLKASRRSERERERQRER